MNAEPLAGLQLALQGSTDADGRVLCGRCHNPVDDDHYCTQCGAVSLPEHGKPRTTGGASKSHPTADEGSTVEQAAAA